MLELDTRLIPDLQSSIEKVVNVNTNHKTKTL